MRLIALLALLGLAAVAAGQAPADEEREEAPPPPLPPLTPPETIGATPLLIPGPGKGPAWLLRVGLLPGWDSRVHLGFPDEAVQLAGVSDFVGRASVDVARRWAGTRGELAVTGQANGAAYAEQRALNQAGFGAGIRGTHHAAPNTTLRVSGSYAYGYARDTSQLVAQGLLLPLALSRVLAAAAGLDLGMGARTTASLDGSYRSMEFDSESVSGGSQATAAARLKRQLGKRADGELWYQIDREVPDAGALTASPPAATTHGAFLGIGGIPRRGLRLGATFGVLYVPASATAESEFSPSGSGTLSLDSRRSRLEASYQRVPQLAYGYGRSTISDNGRLAYQLDLGRRTALLCGGTYSQSRDLRDPFFSLVNVTATAGLSTSFGRGYQTGLTYVYGRREYSDERIDQRPVDSHSLGLSLSKEWAW